MPVSLPQPAPWDAARDALRHVMQHAGDAARRLVIDISTMPRSCFLPVVATALRDVKTEIVVVTYAEPQDYGPLGLASEPTSPTIIPPFDWISSPALKKPTIAWIPILGFGPSFATTVYESLVESYDLRGRVFPLVGFPAFDPMFFERALSESGRGILDALEREHGLRDHFFYSASDNPFETKDAIDRLVAGMGNDIEWIGSPMGPKPMALGMALAALDRKVSIMLSQARSYHPDYSVGIKRVHAYVLKTAGIACY